MSSASGSAGNQSTQGSRFQDPLWSLQAERNPREEHFLILDHSRCWIRIASSEANEYRKTGYAVFDLHGNRVTDFDASHRASVRATEGTNEGFAEQLEGIYKIEDQANARATAHLDEEIFYDPKDHCFKRRVADQGRSSTSEN